mmetsp:Transcript_52514/g.61313  ORF Transcript_52514/g.61313 Transcript_52514/m.61313 type:complete len:176 (+) Transcript_52514:301-828(+)
MIESARRDHDGIILCILDCCISCLQNAVEYFNKWAYIYVGLYGYSYLKAGKNVMTLFRERGWQTIITDDLISNTILLASFVAAGLTGVVGITIDAVKDDWLSGTFEDDAQTVAFLTAFIIGLVMSTIMLSVVASAANAVIVLFAEAPAEFETSHPELSGEMREAWRMAYPATCGF